MNAAPTTTVSLDPTAHAAVMGTSVVIASATEAASFYVDPASDPLDAAATLTQIARTFDTLRDVFAARAGVVVPEQRRGEAS